MLFLISYILRFYFPVNQIRSCSFRAVTVAPYPIPGKDLPECVTPRSESRTFSMTSVGSFSISSVNQKQKETNTTQPIYISCLESNINQENYFLVTVLFFKNIFLVYSLDYSKFCLCIMEIIVIFLSLRVLLKLTLVLYKRLTIFFLYI